MIFGREDILLNNIAWMLRKFPFHPIFGDGDYEVQPIFVDDLAALAVELGHSRENVALDAVGPEVHTYREMVSLILDKIGANSRLIRVNPKVALIVSR
ncbi:MAG TPA: epimerase, partial [Dehalococcoidia bacterium]|nr:epimerase [Dehalococcoidia bacterium]